MFEDAEFLDHTVAMGVGGAEVSRIPGMGVRKAKRNSLFTAGWIGAREAHRLGMVNHVGAALPSWRPSVGNGRAGSPGSRCSPSGSWSGRRSMRQGCAGWSAPCRPRSPFTTWPMPTTCWHTAARVDPTGLMPAIKKRSEQAD